MSPVLVACLSEGGGAGEDDHQRRILLLVLSDIVAPCLPAGWSRWRGDSSAV